MCNWRGHDWIDYFHCESTTGSRVRSRGRCPSREQTVYIIELTLGLLLFFNRIAGEFIIHFRGAKLVLNDDIIFDVVLSGDVEVQQGWPIYVETALLDIIVIVLPSRRPAFIAAVF